MSPALNRWTSVSIRAFIVLGLAVLIVGILADWEDGEYLGLGLMIASPLAGLSASLIALLYERDRRWAAVAAILIAIVVARVAVSVAGFS